jgi:hypothetical protein
MQDGQNLPGGSMIAKTFFLVKIIHRIGTRTFHDKKALHEIFGDNTDIPRGTEPRGDGRAGSPGMPGMFAAGGGSAS